MYYNKLMSQESIIRFEKVSFEYGHNKSILEDVDFSLRRGSKTTIMGQNGAGKSTIFQIITGVLQPLSGAVHLDPGLTIAISRQVISRDQLDLTVLEFFSSHVKASGDKARVSRG